MKIIAHRKNTVNELLSTPKKYGVELDIRSCGDQLIVHHDPYKQGEFFEQWLNAYNHGTLILNIKEEGLELKILEIMKKRRINDFFFLDQSFPFLIKSANAGEKRCAVRVSEFESVSTALSLSGHIDWVWVDYFTHFPLSHSDGLSLKKSGFKICLVSPELQGFDAETEIPNLVSELKKQKIIADAVCTKFPKIWENFFDVK